jgi:hypothetical protein
MDANDMAKLAGIAPNRKTDSGSMLSDGARQIAMLAGLVPASGQSALIGERLVADQEDVSEIEPSIASSDESFLLAMTRAAGINPSLLEEGAEMDADLVPLPVIAPTVIEEAPELIDNACPITVVRNVTVTPKWAFDLRDAVEKLLNKSNAPKESLAAMQAALKESYEVSGNQPEEIVEEVIVESEEQRVWKSYYLKSLEG